MEERSPATKKKYSSTVSPAVIPLCASCDNCRKRKTRCDGQRPCSNCKVKYMRDHRGVQSLDGITTDEFNCVYSPAKRRGPVPKRPSSTCSGLTTGGSAASSTSTNATVNLSPPSSPPQPHPQAVATQVPILSQYSTTLLPLLCSTNHEGNQLRSMYDMVFTSVLPELPEETTTNFAALTAGRFLVLALGALVMNNKAGATTVDHKSVLMYRAALECVRQARTAHQATAAAPNTIMAHVYLLLGVYHLLRGDTDLYVRYRHSVRMMLLRSSEHVGGVCDDPKRMESSLLGSLSYLNSWIYVLHNGNQDTLPRLSVSSRNNDNDNNDNRTLQKLIAEEEQLYWTQGVPGLFLNCSGPTMSRVLDALACVFRLGTDQATKSMNMVVSSEVAVVEEGTTSKTLGPRNLVLAAYRLLEQGSDDHQGVEDGPLRWMVASLDACLSPPSDKNGFTETQITVLLAVANACIQQPILLWTPGPSFHVASNVAVLLAHASNAFVKQSFASGHSARTPKEQLLLTTVQQELYSTYMALARLLALQRTGLPARLQCHLLPTAATASDGTIPIVQNTTLCACHFCQGFVLASAASPAEAKQLLATSERRRTVLERLEAASSRTARSDGLDDGSDLLQAML